MMRAEWSAESAAAHLALLKAHVNESRLNAMRLVENPHVDEPEVEWRTDADERAMDRGPRWHYGEAS